MNILFVDQLVIILNSTSFDMSALAQKSPYLSDLRHYWRDNKGLYVPAEWMVGIQVICSNIRFGNFVENASPIT